MKILNFSFIGLLSISLASCVAVPKQDTYISDRLQNSNTITYYTSDKKYLHLSCKQLDRLLLADRSFENTDPLLARSVGFIGKLSSENFNSNVNLYFSEEFLNKMKKNPEKTATTAFLVLHNIRLRGVMNKPILISNIEAMKLAKEKNDCA